jgi:hypothetical protein
MVETLMTALWRFLQETVASGQPFLLLDADDVHLDNLPASGAL